MNNDAIHLVAVVILIPITSSGLPLFTWILYKIMTKRRTGKRRLESTSNSVHRQCHGDMRHDMHLDDNEYYYGGTRE